MNYRDKVKIEAYKHDGTLNLMSEDTYIIEENSEFLVCGNQKAKITESSGKSYKTKEVAILIFFKKSWFNIICQFKEFGTFFYCNVASPYIIEYNTIKYIDYDLDLRVFPDSSYKILDKNEYVYHKKIYNYDSTLDKIIKNELSKLIEIKKNNKFPFKINEMYKYLDKFKEIERRKKP